LCFLLNITGSLVNEGQIKNEIIELKTVENEIYPLSLFLKKHTSCLYKVLVDIGTYDYPGKKFRFNVFYNLLSIAYNSRLFINTKLLESWPVLDSVIPLYSCAA
jgi:NADH:ubiquinone oxidoreductase subunit C